MKASVLLTVAILFSLFVIAFTGSAQDENPCPGLLTPRLVVGERARVTPGDANNVRSQPLSDAPTIGQIPGEAEFTVLSGPVCGERVVWWEVQYNGMVGWTAEGLGDTYWLEPLGEPACDPNVIIGEPARNEYTALPVYESASEESEIVGEIPVNSLFEVTEGPACASYGIWVQIQFGTIEGWIQETIYGMGPYGEPGSVARPEPRPLPTVTSQAGANPLLPPTPIEVTLAPNAITAENADRIENTLVIGDGWIRGFVWSPDGRYLAVAGTLYIRIYDTNDLNAPPRILDAHSGVVSIILYSPDGALLATGSSDGTVRLWDAETFELLSVLEHDVAVTDVEFSPNSNTVAVAFNQGNIGGLSMWDVQTATSPELLHELDVSSYSLDIEFLPDGRQLVGIGYGSIDLWSVESGDQRLITDLNTGAFRSFLAAAMDPEGKYVTTLVEEMIGDTHMAYFYYLSSWDLETGEQGSGIEYTLPGNENAFGASSIVYSPDGTHVMVNFSGNPQWWGRKQYISELGDDMGIEGVISISFSSDSTLAAFGGVGGEIRLYDALHYGPLDSPGAENALRGYRVRAILYGIVGSVTSIAFSPDSSRLAASGSDNTIRIWDVETGERQGTIRLNGIGSPIALSPDGSTLATTTRLWNIATGEPTDALQNPEDRQANWISYTLDGTLLAASNLHDDNPAIWNGQTAEEMPSLERRTLRLIATQDGRQVAYRVENSVRIVDLATGQIVRDLDQHFGQPQLLQFSPDGRLLAVYDPGTFDGFQRSLLFWHVESGALLANIPIEHLEFYGASFSPDGTRFAWTVRYLTDETVQSTIKLLDLATQWQTEMTPFAGFVEGLSFSSDGSLVAAGDWDSTIHLWDTSNGEVIKQLEGHRDRIEWLAFSRDGAQLFSSSADGTVRVWRLPE